MINCPKCNRPPHQKWLIDAAGYAVPFWATCIECGLSWHVPPTDREKREEDAPDAEPAE